MTVSGFNYSSPPKLANLCNKYFLKEIKKIRNNFIKTTINPIQILEFLIPKNQNTFNLPPITLEKTKKIIKNLKNSNSTGHDLLNNKILKKVKNILAPHITYLINTIIISNIFPDIFKISRILPFPNQINTAQI